MPRYAIGLDFGTNSCRSLLVDVDFGQRTGQPCFPLSFGDRRRHRSMFRTLIWPGKIQQTMF